MSIMSTAGTGKFSTDRTISEYANDIWCVLRGRGGSKVWIRAEGRSEDMF